MKELNTEVFMRNLRMMFLIEPELVLLKHATKDRWRVRMTYEGVTVETSVRTTTATAGQLIAAWAKKKYLMRSVAVEDPADWEEVTP